MDHLPNLIYAKAWFYKLKEELNIKIFFRLLYIYQDPGFFLGAANLIKKTKRASEYFFFENL
jgi:hypothetical protein